MNITLTILGRTAMDEPYSELAASTVNLASISMALTPAVPPEADGQDLRLRVRADDTVSVTLGWFLDPATRPGPAPIKDAEGKVVGEEPAPEPFVHGRFVAWSRQVRELPFKGCNSIVLNRTPRPGERA